MTYHAQKDSVRNLSMTTQKVERVITHAKDRCMQSGARLTPKRETLLALLVTADKPLSPYELVDQYNATTDARMPANSAYRILDFLVGIDLVHKLRSVNKYIACSHITCDHDHAIPQFLICRECSRVNEIMVDEALIKALHNSVADAGYSLMNSHLEIDCLCDRCTK
ncbi:Zinc uptake regulation protein [BD1-7 clade bacterium]|uniref:Zinc uptake regulation protein n=1 Tax=BD1-7 clade bacterium TaxID=2029982 RepID=A0A5S9QY77_9GAMM|nr:Zinc uptake regulation protein [BD1-7 clade bacterium]